MTDQRTLVNGGVPRTASASGTTAIASNAGRVGFSIENTGTGPIFVRLGAGATNDSYHVILKAGTAPADGNGATFSMLSGVCFTGEISASGTLASFVTLEV